MNSKRINYVTCVREALAKMGVSVVAVINAVNGEYVRASIIKAGKMGAPKHTKATKKKVSVCKISETGSRYECPRTIVTEFDDWAMRIEKADELATIPEIEIPAMFHAWLIKFRPATPETKQGEPNHTEDFANHTGEQ